MSSDEIYKSFAIIGSTILVICIFPQINKMYKNKSAKDISNAWLVSTIVGLVFLCFYSFHFELWEIFIPILIQFVLFIFLMGLKKHYDRINQEEVLPN